MENVQVYMLQNDSNRGSRYATGQIYSVEQHIDEEMEHNEVAKVVKYPSLDAIDKEIETATDNLKASINTVDNDARLSKHGKSVKKQELLTATKADIEALGVRYNKELERLKQKAQRDATTTERQKNYESDKVTENVGIIISEVHMSSSFTQALEAVQQQLDFVDQDIARRLLSQFHEIKKVLDEKGAQISSSDRYVRDLYKEVKAAATSDQQASNSLDYRILQRIEQTRNYRGHYPVNFPRIK